jgi:hypothetical protein
MTERAHRLNAQLECRSSPGAGTRIAVKVHLDGLGSRRLRHMSRWWNRITQ